MLGAFVAFNAVVNVLSFFCWIVLAALTAVFARGTSRFLLCGALLLRALVGIPAIVQSFGVRFPHAVSSTFATVSNVAFWVELLLVVLAVVLDARRRKGAA